MKTAKALNPSKKLVYSVGKLAEVLGIGLPALKVGGRYLIPKQALQRWLGNQASNNRDWNRVIFVGEK